MNDLPLSHSRTNQSALGRLLAAALFVSLLAAACSSIDPVASAPVRVECNVPDATVWVDDVPLGRAADLARETQIRAGFHRVEIRHPDHFTFYAELTVRHGEPAMVRAQLRPLLD